MYCKNVCLVYLNVFCQCLVPKKLCIKLTSIFFAKIKFSSYLHRDLLYIVLITIPYCVGRICHPRFNPDVLILICKKWEIITILNFQRTRNILTTLSSHVQWFPTFDYGLSRPTRSCWETQIYASFFNTFVKTKT